MRLTAGRQLFEMSGKALVIPPEGWHAHSFAQHGAPMIRALHRAAQVTQRRAIPVIARAAVKIFNRQLEKVIAIVNRRAGSRKAEPLVFNMEIEIAADETLWLQAMQEVFAETGNELVVELMPPIQSVMAQGYSKTNLLLGQEARVDVNAMVARKARGIADKITRINETTRKEFSTIIRNGVADGLTNSELTKELRTQLPEINASRQLTIARTESGRAWDQGTVASFKESQTLAEVSVIGCEAREPNNQWQYRGASTCNFPDLPIGELDEFMAIGFHPNHGGSIVPSAFFRADGTIERF